MLSRTVFAASIAICAAVVTQAGEIKTHSWPTAFASQDGLDIASIPVTMDVQPFVSVSGGTIRLEPTDSQIYEGCRILRVLCNFPLAVRCSIIPTGDVEGQYSCSIANPYIDPPGGIVKLCVRLTDAQLENQLPRNNVRVAVVKMTVVPRS